MTMTVAWLALAALGGALAGYLAVSLLERRRRRAVGEAARRQLASESRLCWMAELPGGVLHVSPPLADLLGRDAIGPTTTIFDLLASRGHPDDARRVQHVLGEFQQVRRAYEEGEIRIRCADGGHHRFFARMVVSWDASGRPCLLTGSLLDLTRTREIEEERDRLFNLSVDMLGISDFEGNLQQVNPAWVRILRWSRDDVMSRPLTDFIHPEDLGAFAEYLQRLATGDPVRDLELRARCRDGSFRWISWSSYPLPDRRRIFTVARDVTEKREADARLQAYQSRLRSLAAELTTVEDRERRQLAEILHDGLAQDLFAARAKITLLKYPDRVADPARVVTDALEILDSTMQTTRNLTFEIFPPALYEMGLDAALEWLCRHFETSRGLRCELVIEGESRDLAQDVRALSYRIVRELLTNVHKHASAHRARIAVEYAPDHLQIAVDDDGKAFAFVQDPDEGPVSPDDQPGAGFGLFSIRERVRSLAGDLAIGPSRLGGWRVVMSLPLAHPTD